MQLKTIITAFILSALHIFSSTAQESLTRNLDEFYSLEVIGNIRMEIYPSDQSRADIILENTTPDKIITDISNFALSIRLRTDTPKDARVTVKLYFKDLHKISVSANAYIVSDTPLTGKDVEFIAKSGGRIDLELALESLDASVTQGGAISFTGSVRKQIVNVSTGGTYSAYELQASDTYVKAASGGTAKVTAEKIIDATANFKGFIGYKGNPASTYIKTNLGGEIASFSEIPVE